MSIERYMNVGYLTGAKEMRLFLPLVVCIGIVLSNVCVFLIVPNEQVMGAVQRVFYFHVGCAMGCYLGIGTLFVASIFYLATKKPQWDVLAQAGASTAFTLATAVLVSGMIWGHSAWNTWWRWEPRLVSFLVLWLILLSYGALRSFGSADSRHRSFAAVLGIIAAVHVPIVIFSVRLLDQTQQLHPEVVATQGLRDARFVYTLVLANLSVMALAIWLTAVRAGNLLLERELERLQVEIRYR